MSKGHATTESITAIWRVCVCACALTHNVIIFVEIIALCVSVNDSLYGDMEYMPCLYC